MAESKASSADKTPPKPDVMEAIIAHIAETKGISVEEAREGILALGRKVEPPPGAPSIESFLTPEPATVFYIVKDGRNDVTGVSTRLWLGSTKTTYSDRDGNRVVSRPRIRLNVENVMDAREMMFPHGASIMRFDIAKAEGIRVTPQCVEMYPEAKVRSSDYDDAYTLRDAMEMFPKNRAIRAMILTGEIRSEANIRMLIGDKVQDFTDRMKRWRERGERGPKPSIQPITREELGWPRSMERASGAVGRITIRTPDGMVRDNLAAIPAMAV